VDGGDAELAEGIDDLEIGALRIGHYYGHAVLPGTGTKRRMTTAASSNALWSN
jgi:hypothetical protein